MSRDRKVHITAEPSFLVPLSLGDGNRVFLELWPDGTVTWKALDVRARDHDDFLAMRTRER